MSKDPVKVSSFYEKIFGWKITHMPEMNYRLVETGGQGGINGGILKPEREGRWPGNMTLYIDVDDLAAYRERIVFKHFPMEKKPQIAKPDAMASA
jgi:predicted enzyme related to lactoylglutathione lyase